MVVIGFQTINFGSTRGGCVSGIPTVIADFRRVSLPAELRTHPLVARKWYYTLSATLLRLLLGELGESRFDAESLRCEQLLTESAEAIPGCVGFSDGTPICDGMLRLAPDLRNPDPTLQAYLEKCQQAGHCDENLLSLVARRRELLSLPRQGYLGWLWTNRAFLAEFRRLAEDNSFFAEGRRLPQLIASPANIPGARRMNTAQGGSSTALQEFCRRWRLQEVTGPATVHPLAVHVPALLPADQSAQAHSSGAVVYFPDIAPLPDRDELRQLLEDNVRPAECNIEHLQEWRELVSSDTQGKKPIGKFARWYPLQHYYHVLHSRHHETLTGCQQKLSLVFGEFFEVSEDTIERDLREIARRLGNLWP